MVRGAKTHFKVAATQSINSPALNAKTTSPESYNKIYATLENKSDETQDIDKKTNIQNNNVPIRENFSETAFFYPSLLTDKNGKISIKFTLPESITSWRFMGLAHDKNMNNGIITADAIAKKTIMIQPNMPRFLRIGDKANISANIFNTSKETVEGNAVMQLVDPETI